MMKIGKISTKTSASTHNDDDDDVVKVELSYYNLNWMMKNKLFKKTETRFDDDYKKIALNFS